MADVYDGPRGAHRPEGAGGDHIDVLEGDLDAAALYEFLHLRNG